MKIKDYAAEKGLTQGAVYKAITRAGHSTKELTDRKGNITEKGSAILADLFPDAEIPRSEPLKETQPDNSTIEELRTRLRAAEERADKWEGLYLELQQKVERERAAFLDKISEANRLISQQQELARIASMNPIKRLFAGKKKKPTDAIDTNGQVS